MGGGGITSRLSSALANGPGLVVTFASGLPRSQARLSKSPNTWQLAQAESPWLDERVAPLAETAMPWGSASERAFSGLGIGAQQAEKSMCLLRWRGATPPPCDSTVILLSWRWPRRLWPANVPGPSKRSALLASVLA